MNNDDDKKLRTRVIRRGVKQDVKEGSRKGAKSKTSKKAKAKAVKKTKSYREMQKTARAKERKRSRKEIAESSITRFPDDHEQIEVNEVITKNYPVNTNNFTETEKETLKLLVRTFYAYQEMRMSALHRSLDSEDYEVAFDERLKREKRQKKKTPPVTQDMTEWALVELASNLRDPIPDIASHKQEREEKRRWAVGMMNQSSGKPIKFDKVGMETAPPTLEEAARMRIKDHGLVLYGLEFSTLKEIDTMLNGIGIYDSFLKGVLGCGPTMSGVILSEISMSRRVRPELIPDTVGRTYYKVVGTDFVCFKATVVETWPAPIEGDEPKSVTRHMTCYELEDGTVMQDCCPTVSSLWSYAGLALDLETGEAVRRRKGAKSNWNPHLKTKMVGVLASCLIRAHKKKDSDGNPVNSKYQSFYYSYKHRKQSQIDDPDHACKWTPKHLDNASKRYMIKMFLLDLWKVWRAREGLPTPDPYMEAMLGRNHGDHGGASPSA